MYICIYMYAHRRIHAITRSNIDPTQGPPGGLEDHFSRKKCQELPAESEVSQTPAETPLRPAATCRTRDFGPIFLDIL